VFLSAVMMFDECNGMFWIVFFVLAVALALDRFEGAKRMHWSCLVIWQRKTMTAGMMTSP